MVLLAAVSLFTTGMSVPALALEYTLFVYGNANRDQNIDRKDVALLQQIIAGKAEKTDLADANQDGVVDEADLQLVEAIIAGRATSLVVRDAYGKPVRIGIPVRRIVSLDQMIAENAKVLGIGRTIVGIDKKTADKSIIHPDISRVANVGSDDEPDIERIIELKPDLVVDNQYFDEEMMQKLRSVGVLPLSMIYHGDIQNSLGYSKVLGMLTGSASEASDYIDWMSGVLDTIHNRLAATPYEQRAKVIYLFPKGSGALGSGGNDCPTIKALQYLGANTMTDNTRDIKGVVMDRASYFEIDPEVVIGKNPEVIVMEDFDTALGYGLTDRKAAQAELDRVMARSGFADLRAVKNKKVYLLDVNIVSHSNCLGAIYMAKALYPEVLRDIDPYAIHQHYVDNFLRLDSFDVRRNGLFIFPEVRATP